MNGFISCGAEFASKMNGIFAFAVWDSEKLYLFRDRTGVKPLFYTFRDKSLVFGSKIKALLAYPGIEAVIDKDGLCDIFALGPARRAETGVSRTFTHCCPDIMPSSAKKASKAINTDMFIFNFYQAE